jgi:hypothetical protein
MPSECVLQCLWILWFNDRLLYHICELPITGYEIYFSHSFLSGRESMVCLRCSFYRIKTFPQSSSHSISNCFMPTLPSCTTSRTLRKIGYYAGWGNRRVNCSDSDVSPDQIDFTGYTHAQFAFATISQALTIRSSLELYSFSSSDHLIK